MGRLSARRGFLAACLAVTAVGAALPAAAQATAAKPKRVLIVLFDGMRPEMADRFNMPNFRALRDSGVSAQNAQVGHLLSTTVIAHNAIVSGLQPRHMGWTDEVYRDTGNVLGAGADTLYSTGLLTTAQFGALAASQSYPKLADYLRARTPGSKFVMIGWKSYPSDSVDGNSGPDDIAIRMSSRGAAADCPNLGGRWRSPFGHNVPTYLTQPACGRYYVNSDSANDYGTATTSPAWVYPLDGNRSVPGFDAEHLGGDTWVADAASEMMGRENWNGMFVTLGGMDKASHMWGPDDSTALPPGDPAEQTRLAFEAHNADAQLGKLVARLRELGQLDETLIVLTADHGFQSNSRAWYGDDAPGQAWVRSTYGNIPNDTNYVDVLPGLRPLVDAGNMQSISSGTIVTEYLIDKSRAQKRAAARLTRSVPGVIATYWRDGSRYVLDSSHTATPMSASERTWWNANAQSLVNTMAADYGPDVIGLVADRIGYGAYGDHGGAQEAVQRIPIVFWTPGIKRARPTATIRQRDILPTALRALGIPLAQPVDGRAVRLEFRR